MRSSSAMANGTRPFLLLTVLTVCVFGNALFNDFTGDDHAIIVENSFYSSLENVPKLFKKDYTSDPVSIDRGPGQDYGSGSVAYRPALSFTYFLDHALWEKNPFGYHLTSLLLHIANVILAYLLFSCLMPAPAAQLAGMLFAIHPVQTEAVCAIGYRADLLVTFFVLSCMLSWVRYRQKKEPRWAVMALFMYSLALFSKEAALLMPAIILTYDLCLARAKLPSRTDAYRKQAWFLLLAAFYLMVYLKIFPNPALYTKMFLGKDIIGHLISVQRIWEFNIYSMLFPFNVTSVPPLYSPPLSSTIVNSGSMLSFIISAGLLVLAFRYFLQNRTSLLFLLVWFLASYIPISGLIATPNPLGYRFLYLPSIGLVGILAYYLNCSAEWLNRHTDKQYGKHLISFLLIASGMITFFNNQDWRNNYTLATRWIKDYPSFYKSHLVLGREYFRAMRFDKVIPHLEPFWQDFAKLDPWGLYCLAESHYQVGDKRKAFFFFKVLVHKHPSFSEGYFGLGKCALDQSETEQAIALFGAAIDREPKEMYFRYLAARSMRPGDEQETAKAVIRALLERHPSLPAEYRHIFPAP